MNVFIIIGICVVALILFLYFVPVGIWFQALVSGVYVSLVQLIFMRFRKVPPTVIVGNMISASKAGLKLKQNDLEAHYLAGGHVGSVVNALISADKANMKRAEGCADIGQPQGYRHSAGGSCCQGWYPADSQSPRHCAH